MSRSGPFLAPRSFLVSLTLLVLQSVLLLQLPLLNVLGLEYAVASSPLVALLSGLSIRRRRVPDPDQPARTRTEPPYAILVLYIVIPFALGLLNGFRVTQCAVWEGILYYLLVVPFAAAFGAALSHFSFSLSPHRPRVLFVLLWLGTILHIPVVAFFGLQIFAYNPIVGFFPGFSYDDALEALPGLATYRITTLVLVVAIMLSASILDEWRQRRIISPLPRNISVVAWVLLAVVWLRSDDLGFSSSLDHVRAELGGLRETEHFTIVYPASGLTDAEADRLAHLHEFHYNRIARTLRVEPRKKVVSVVYASADQKARLCGGGRTNFAKPWLWQLHIMSGDVERVLKHELTHVLAAEFGFPIIRVATNAGMIEGLAVALERESYGMSIHRAAAAILTVRPDVRLDDVFGLTGFFTTHAAVSYTLAGSFCRFLIERYEVRTFKKAYESGSLFWYGKTLEDLLREWRRRLEEVTLTREDSIKAAYIFRRPPQFSEECYRFKGNLLQDARRALADGHDSLALERVDRALSRTYSFDAVYLRSVILTRMGRYDEALGEIGRYRQRDTVSFEIPLRFVEADARWGGGDVAGAVNAYDAVARVDLSTGWTESALLRKGLAGTFPADTGLLGLLNTPMSDSARTAGWTAVLAERDHPFLRIAASRVLDPSKDGDRLHALIDDLTVPGEPFLSFVMRVRSARAYLDAGSYERAKGYFWEALNYTTDEVRIRWIEEQIDWAGWLEKRKSP